MTQSIDPGCITAVPSELRALAAAIGKYPEGAPDVSVMAEIPLPAPWGDVVMMPLDGSTPYMASSRLAANDNYPRVVGFTGLAGSGKSTATKYLVERHGYTLVKFAGPLKAAMAAMGFSHEQIEGELKETPCAWLNFKTPRHAMQTLGTEWGRDCIGEDFWSELWVHHANRVIAEGRRVVVDDCRFPNEAEAIRQLGGVIVKLDGRGGIAGAHSSENGCGTHDAVVDNDGCVTALYASVEEAVRRLAA